MKVSWKTLVLEAGLSLLVKVSWKTLVLEAWIVTFGESLVENARFGSLDCHFWSKSRVKRSFWKLGFSLLVKVSWKMLVLEACLVCKSVLTREASKSVSVQQERQERVSSRSRGSTHRSRTSPLGRRDSEAVHNGNLMVGRVMVLILLAAAKGVWWTLEQPSSSVMEYHPTFQRALKLCHGVQRLPIDMWHFRAASKKANPFEL